MLTQIISLISFLIALLFPIINHNSFLTCLWISFLISLFTMFFLSKKLHCFSLPLVLSYFYSLYNSFLILRSFHFAFLIFFLPLISNQYLIFYVKFIIYLMSCSCLPQSHALQKLDFDYDLFITIPLFITQYIIVKQHTYPHFLL